VPRPAGDFELCAAAAAEVNVGNTGEVVRAAKDSGGRRT